MNVICQGCELDSGREESTSVGANMVNGWDCLGSGSGDLHYFCPECTAEIVALASQIMKIVKDEHVTFYGMICIGRKLHGRKDRGA